MDILCCEKGMRALVASNGNHHGSSKSPQRVGGLIHGKVFTVQSADVHGPPVSAKMLALTARI